jgi:L-asparaginase/Glu-tRNA(Gln) amidotransferase subunit D
MNLSNKSANIAYTATALPFMLQDLKKTVIIAGAQIPLCKI